MIKSYRFADDSDDISDFFTSKLFKNMKEITQFSNYDLFLQLQGDGFQIFKDSRHDCYIITLTLLNLPPNIRGKKENVWVVAMIPGPSAPKDIDSFIQPVLEELRYLERGFRIYDSHTDQVVNGVKAFLVLASGDMKFLEKLFHCAGSSGKKCCRFCNLVGVRSFPAKKYYYPLLHPIIPTALLPKSIESISSYYCGTITGLDTVIARNVIDYDATNLASIKRSEDEILRDMNKAEQ